MQSLFGFGPVGEADIIIPHLDSRKCKTRAAEGGAGDIKLPIYSSGEDIVGEVKVTVPGGKRLDHGGMRVELKGLIEIAGEKQPQEFCSIVADCCGAGNVSGVQRFPFRFSKPELLYESYLGINARVRYYLRAIVTKGPSKELEIVVQNCGGGPSADAAPQAAPAGGLSLAPASSSASLDSPIKLEVGIEECLHIEFEYAKGRYHLSDVVTGRIDFLLVRIKIKHMEVAVIRRESAGTPGSQVNESETLTRFEVMDGAPVRGERIPIRLPLSGLDLTPTYREVAGGLLNVRYFLNLVLVDEEDRRYFKQQEVQLWRREIKE